MALTTAKLETYNRHKVYKEEDEEQALEKVKQAIKENEKLLLVANTVRQAQSWFQWAEEQLPTIKKMLIHSRFRRKDRAALEKKLKEEFDEKEGPCLVVSTQVVEVSLDISFDRMLTQAAPIDALVQRFGRVNRRRLEPEKRRLYPVHILAPPEKTLPYDEQAVQTSWNVLPDNGEVLQETQLQEMIDEVYPEIDVQRIESQILWKGEKLKREKLTHSSKAILLELLDIQSATCILPQDLEAYTFGNYITRSELEIPMSMGSLWAYGEMVRIEKGSWPSVLPPQPNYKPYGALPPEKDKPPSVEDRML